MIDYGIAAGLFAFAVSALLWTLLFSWAVGVTKQRNRVSAQARRSARATEEVRSRRHARRR